MAASGTWKLLMQTPIGERKAQLVLAAQGNSLTGTMTSDEGNTTQIFDGTSTGDDIAFKAAIKSPMPLTLQFAARIAGDKITGTVNASGVGSWGFSGTRA